ncbi:MAG TPA: Do family serine endopeptidase [Planctomycetota bacterium]|nr:Do family serine endopeptidase [Planctomycetota bacterium]
MATTRKKLMAVTIAAVLTMTRAASVQAGEVPLESPTARALGEEYQKAAAAAAPAVVHVASSRQIGGLGDDFFGKFFEIPRDLMALGSGVIVRPDGYILTNYHVIKGSEKLKVKTQDGREFSAEVVGIDPPTDLAVIKINAGELPVAELGDSDRIAVGNSVLAIGNPFGLDSTVTQGIISAKGRANVGIADYEDFIQTDAAINPGNSGGPLINIGGRVIGINTAIFSRSGGFQGIGFAIPSNMAKRVLDELISQGHVTRGYLGVTIQNITPELAQALNLTVDQGAVVTDVIPGSPAAKAGFQKGDVIVEFDGRKIVDARQLRSTVATTAIGSRVGVTVIRHENERKLMVAIGEQRMQEAPPASRLRGTAIDRLGLEVRDLTDQIRQRYNIKAKTGVFVVGVIAGGPADTAGVKSASVILEANHKDIASTKDLEKVLSKIDPGDNILLLVQEAGLKYYVVIRPEE